MSVDLIFGQSPPPALDVSDSSAPADAGPLPRVVVTDVTTDSVETLLVSAAHGDQEAFVELQARIAGLVQVNVRRILRDGSQAEAVTRETFAEVLEGSVHFDPDRNSAQTWLLTRAHQHAMDRLRSVDGTGLPARSTQPAPVLLV